MTSPIVFAGTQRSCRVFPMWGHSRNTDMPPWLLGKGCMAMNGTSSDGIDEYDFGDCGYFHGFLHSRQPYGPKTLAGRRVVELSKCYGYIYLLMRYDCVMIVLWL